MNFESQARTILSPVTGFIAQAGFTHSLTPARNCTYGCTYCYVPTMHVFGGLKREDWERWGQFTTFKANAADLLARELRPEQIIYCSPLVDPYQPVEAERLLMPQILEAVAKRPPRVFVVQTRSSMILRDVTLLQRLSDRTRLRVSFSLTTNSESVRKVYEPHCQSFDERVAAIHTLTVAGIATHATLAPLLPCDPERLADAALEATTRDLIGDPLHVRATEADWRYYQGRASNRSSTRPQLGLSQHSRAKSFPESERSLCLVGEDSRLVRTGSRVSLSPEDSHVCPPLHSLVVVLKHGHAG
ncbi:MAG: radical SAM protein [Bryobacteraceae bacterium]